MSDENRKKDEAFDRRVAQSQSSLGADKQRLERTFNEEEPNLIKLRQDVQQAIAVERQLEQQVKNRRRKQFETADNDSELTDLEEKLERHREVKEKLKSQLTAREQQLQKIYDEKPSLILDFLKEPKNIFALVVVLVILEAVHKIILP
ncbi:MAG TPA: hypothetical protein V6C76_12265 [Drouetiella sp.]